eukprot:Colp12_sorted_trinity150504_noHs@12424
MMATGRFERNVSLLFNRNTDTFIGTPIFLLLDACLKDPSSSKDKVDLALEICVPSRASTALECYEHKEPVYKRYIGTLYIAALMMVAREKHEVDPVCCETIVGFVKLFDVAWLDQLHGEDAENMTHSVGLVCKGIGTVIAYVPKAAKYFFDAGVIPALLKMIDSTWPIPERTHASDSLCMFAKTEEGVAAIVEAEGFGPLLKLATEATANPAQNFYQSMGFPSISQMNASIVASTSDPFIAILNLCFAENTKPRLDVLASFVHENGVRLLYDHLTHPTTSSFALVHGARMLQRMSNSFANLRKKLMAPFIEQTPIEKLLLLMTHKEKLVHLNLMAVAMWTLPHWPALQDALLDDKTRDGKARIKFIIKTALENQAPTALLHAINDLEGGPAMIKRHGLRVDFSFLMSEESKKSLSEDGVNAHKEERS